jgi:DUF4097 and DUF4098 domain-containing protein YvlB
MKPILAALCAACLFTGGARADTHEQTVAVAPDVRIDVEVLSGKIEFRAIDANEVRVRSQGEIELDVSRRGRRVSLRAPSGGPAAWRGGIAMDLELEVPRGSRIDARTVNGGIKVEGVNGELSLHAANGKIEVKGAPQEAYLETLNSPIQFQGDHSEVVAKTLNGEIELEGVSGEVEASTVSGRIRVEGDQIERAELRTMAGEIELESSLAENARVFARSYSGAVRLRLPRHTSARFDVQSFSGGVQSEFASRIEDDEPRRHGPPGRLSFVVGDGDARISIESFSGGVKIEASGD